MTPLTRLATLVLAISWLPCTVAADAGSDFADAERRLKTAFEQKLEAEVDRTLERVLEQKVENQTAALMVLEQYQLAGLSRQASALPAAPARDATAAAAAQPSEAPPPATRCTFAPPSTFVCVPAEGRGSSGSSGN